MDCDPARADLIRNLDRVLMHVSDHRADVQRRLAKQASRLTGLDLGYSAFAIFEALSEKAMRITELAAVLHVPPSTLTRQIQSLEGQGLINRLPDEQDGRASIVELSDEGIQVADSIESLRTDALIRASDGLDTQDLQRVISVIERLAGILRPGS